ncbi:MAG TPA: MASE1 domain-containing protein [Candidatus Binatia bacterium]|nr:MASE1 domain-containing protein [Candidatus Binatia bacterium]
MTTRAQIPLTAVLYLAAAKLGLSMAVVAPQVTAVWPPTGIALAAVLLLGDHVWPGIALGAFLANVTAHEPVATAVGIACGNTLEALAGAWLLRRAGFQTSLARVRDVVAFVGLAALASTTVAATVGVTSLALGHVHPWRAFGPLWGLWWVGDAMGDLVVGSAILVWASPPGAGRRERIPHVALLFGTVLLVSALVFGGRPAAPLARYPLHYLVFPCVIWAALRLRQRGTATTTLLASAVAIWGTASGRGPFVSSTADEGLVLLQLFMAVVGVTGLLLGAAMLERDASEERRARELGDADRRKDEFIAMLAHELRNPLAALDIAVHLLGKRGDERKRFADQAERQVKLLLRLVDDLLDVSRITAGKMTLRRQPILLGEVVARALETVRPLIEARRHTCTVSLPPAPLRLEADPDRLAQVFGNLLSNAARYTAPGGVISLGAEQQDHDVVVRITDTGIGLAPELLPQLFDPFVRGDAAHALAQGGLGIGLTIVRRLVQMHGGRVEAGSSGPHGTEFRVYLPLTAPTETDGGRRPAPAGDS